MTRALLIILLGCFLVRPSGAQDTNLDDYLESIRTNYDLPALAAAVVQNGDVVASGAVGTRVYGMDIPVTINDRFHIGSITKAMTATLAGMMVDEGKLRWDSTIGGVLGDDIDGMNETLAAVTLKQLLTHSSGIPRDTLEMIDIYYSSDAFHHNLPELRLRALDAWKDNEPIVPQGSPFRYSNFGYMIAGMMIEKAAGKSWEQLMHDRLFGPLELASAGLGPQATMGLFDAPVGHRRDGEGQIVPVPWGPAADFPLVAGPAGPVHMSVLDLATWAAWNAGQGERGPQLVRPETLQAIRTAHVARPYDHAPDPGAPPESDYGLGWAITAFYWAGEPVLWHNGSNGFNFAMIVVDPEDDFGVVVMTNFPRDAGELASREVLRHLYLEYVPQ